VHRCDGSGFVQPSSTAQPRVPAGPREPHLALTTRVRLFWETMYPLPRILISAALLPAAAYWVVALVVMLPKHDWAIVALYGVPLLVAAIAIALFAHGELNDQTRCISRLCHRSSDKCRTRIGGCPMLSSTRLRTRLTVKHQPMSTVRKPRSQVLRTVVLLGQAAADARSRRRVTTMASASFCGGDRRPAAGVHPRA